MDELARNKKKRCIKIVIRRLPPYMTWDELKVQLDPIPPAEYVSFVSADLAFEPNAFCRCYIGFSLDVNVIEFSNRFNRYVFVDSKGYESAAIVELALFGKLPKTTPQDAINDSYCGRVHEEYEYKQFVDELETSRNCTYLSLEEQIRAVQVRDETSKTGHYQQTPLTKFIVQKNEEKIKKNEERRKLKGDEKKRMKDKKDEEKKKTYDRSQDSPLTKHESRAKLVKFGLYRGPQSEDAASTSWTPTSTEKTKEKPPKKRESKPKESKAKEKFNTSGGPNKERNVNKNSQSPKTDNDSKPDRPYKYVKTFVPSRITALSSDPYEKKKNKDRPDREIYRPGQRTRDPTDFTQQQ